ncbi:hypothetical protein C8R44DRAFT_744162 [Mycena epipterygia]|nr:hypothetical protein C8R44DRAFT_744162 [Mycena epipterygia]
MPHQSTATEIRLSGIANSLSLIVPLLDKLSVAFGASFIQAISSTTVSLMTAVQNVKRNKDECLQLIENIHGILYAIIDLHIKSETAGSLPPVILNHIGKFTEYSFFNLEVFPALTSGRTFHKIHTFVEGQQDGNKIKYFFRQNEMNILRKNCRTGLEEALMVFKVEIGLIVANNMAEMQKKTEIMHRELLELAENLSDGTTSDRASSMYGSTTSLNNSSGSFSMLPGQPKIFHGRQSELENIVTSITQHSAYIAILGPGGIGKTSLARAVLHHPEVAAKYEHRFFVAADSATTSMELAVLAASHLGLKPGKDLTKAVVQFLSRGPPCLLVLDNLETSWEPLKSRSGVEEFLSLLTDVPHLTLIITMRGAERPAKIRWTRPFLEPLKPLSHLAARQTFIEIADDFHDSNDVDQLLQLTDNLPLAVDIIAHLVDYESCSTVLARWEIEKTALLSTGYDKRSSLDASVSMSLESPRMTPAAKALLSLLSILPDGLSNIELVESHLPIHDILGCRATLLRTSLAYSDDKHRLKSLVPIREHIHTFSPPSAPLFRPLSKYFHLVLDLNKEYNGAAQNHARVNQITSNLGNLRQLLQLELHPENPDLADVIDYILSLNEFSQRMAHGVFALMDYIPAVLPQPCDHRMEVKYITGMFSIIGFRPIANQELLLQQGMAHVNHLNDPIVECNFYNGVGHYYWRYKNDLSAARKFHEKALSLAKFAGTSRQQKSAHFVALHHLFWIKRDIGDYSAAQVHAHEAQRIAQLSANLHYEGLALDAEVVCLTALGDLKDTVVLGQRARELLQRCGMQDSTASYSAMAHLAEAHLMKSEYRETRKIHVELSQGFSGQYETAVALLNIAEIDVIVGAGTLEVQQNLDDAKRKFSDLGMIREVNQCEIVMAELCLREGNTTVAKMALQQCLNASWGKDSSAVSYCLERLANVDRWSLTKTNWSRGWPVIYLAQAHKTQEKLALHNALLFIGDVLLFEGDEYTAHNLFVVALKGFTYMDVHHSKAHCMLRLGDIAKHRGQLAKAVELWKMAHPLFERSSQAKDMAQIDIRLALVDQTVFNTHQKTLELLDKLEAPITSLGELSIHNTGSKSEKLMSAE